VLVHDNGEKLGQGSKLLSKNQFQRNVEKIINSRNNLDSDIDIPNEKHDRQKENIIEPTKNIGINNKQVHNESQNNSEIIPIVIALLAVCCIGIFLLFLLIFVM